MTIPIWELRKWGAKTWKLLEVIKKAMWYREKSTNFRIRHICVEIIAWSWTSMWSREGKPQSLSRKQHNTHLGINLWWGLVTVWEKDLLPSGRHRGEYKSDHYDYYGDYSQKWSLGCRSLIFESHFLWTNINNYLMQLMFTMINF